MTPSRTSESCARIGLLVCWKDVDDTVDGRLAELVCKVPKVKWPVSAILSADSIVSRSRNFADEYDVGVFTKSGAANASVKLLVSAWSSRWLNARSSYSCARTQWGPRW